MRRKWIAAILIVCLLLGCFGIYNRYLAYAVYYNMGNMSYKQYSFDKAMRQYQQALDKKVPKGKECRIRINLALAMIETLDIDYAAPDEVYNSIAILEDAREWLLGAECATEDGTGHSAEAEQLKKEIDEILEQLYEESESSEGEKQDSEPQETDTQEVDAKEQSVREEIAKMQEKAFQDRESERQFMQEFDLETVFEYEGNIW